MVLRHLLFQMSQVIAAAFLLSCAATTQTVVANRQYAAGTGPSDKLQLPAPFDTPSARNNSKVIGWTKGKMPTAAPGSGRFPNPARQHQDLTRISVCSRKF